MRFTSTKKPLKVKVPGYSDALDVNVEVKEFETFAEAIQALGGEDGAKNFINRAHQAGAKQSGRTYATTIKVPEGANKDNFLRDTILPKIAEIVANFSPNTAAGGGFTGTEAKSIVSQLQALTAEAASLSADEYAAKVQAILSGK
jgi:hypothetical protein